MTGEETPTQAAALRLLDVMWGATPEAWSTLSHRPADSDRLVHTAVRTDDRDAWARWLAEHQHTDCYYRLCPMERPPDLPAHRGDAAATVAVPALFADVDVRSEKHPGAPERADVAERLKTLNVWLALSAVVNTGNGWQVYAVFDEPACPGVAVGLIARWDRQLATLGLKNDRSNLDSLMRLPGTVNNAGRATVGLTIPGEEP